jgi:hypothetical protein
VQVTTLAEVARDHGLERVDLIKLDVEGAEAEALEGLGPMLADRRPAMLVEILDDAAGARVEALLDGLDYLFLDVDDRPSAGPKALTRRPHLRRNETYNWLVVTEAQARRLGQMIA